MITQPAGLKLLNYTPHRELVYRPEGGEPIVLPQMGNVRLKEIYSPAGELPNGFPLVLLSYGEPMGLPNPEPGVVYVVSQLVVNACLQRSDLVFPAGLVRDGQGSIIGFTLLARPAGLP